MLWLFVIFGLSTFAASIFGFFSTVRSRSTQSAIHFIALFLVAVAWVLGHQGGGGWGAMLVAMMLEGGIWGRVYLRVSLAEVQTPSEPNVISTEQPVMPVAVTLAAPLVAARPAPT